MALFNLDVSQDQRGSAEERLTNNDYTITGVEDGWGRRQVHPTLLRGMSEDPMENWCLGSGGTCGCVFSHCGTSEQKAVPFSSVFHVVACYSMF